MKTKTNARQTDTTSSHASGATEKAFKNFEQAVRTSVKFQEEAARCWTNVLNQGANAQDWQKQVANFTNFTSGLLPAAQKQMQGVLELMEKNSRTGVELMKKAVDAAQTSSVVESQNKWLDVCTSSLGAVRTTTEAVAQINAQAIDSCINFLRRSSDHIAKAHTTRTTTA